jgi:hypothetical protein
VASSTRSSHARAAGGLHELVRVADGRVGEVAGFFRREDECVLVQFLGGACGEFRTADAVELFPARRD